ncbi:MAG: hypothetical protein GY705_15680 [Bacteroidetes bacterium]|nr:hypothetical protein [Bacteroidota bacterium]
MKSNPFFLFLLFLLGIWSCRTTKPPQDTSFEESLYLHGPANFDYWNHTPLHPANRTNVSFSMKASDSAGITKVKLYLMEFELYNENGFLSKRKRKRGVWEEVEQWDFPAGVTDCQLDYHYHRGFPAKTNVEYVFRVINSKGENTDRFATFDAGRSPWPNNKILLYSTSRQFMRNNINLCFFPDTDYHDDMRRFLKEVGTLIYEGYHSNNMIRNDRNKWAFYYTKHTADGEEVAGGLYPDFLEKYDYEGIDAFGLLHEKEFSDNARVREYAYNIFTSETKHFGTAVHETAHAIFRLYDEYPGFVDIGNYSESINMFTSEDMCIAFKLQHGFSDSSCTQVPDIDGNVFYTPEMSVLFNTEDACETFNRTHGYPENHCQLFLENNIRHYRANDGLCIMYDDGDEKVNDFQRACSVVIQQFYGNFIPEPQLDTSLYVTEVLNYPGYEKVIRLGVEENNGNWDIQLEKVGYGVPDKNFAGERDVQLFFSNAEDSVQYSFAIKPPSSESQYQPGYDKGTEGGGKTSVTIPFMKDFAKVTCQIPPPKGMVRSYGNTNENRKVFHLENDFKKACKKWNK